MSKILNESVKVIVNGDEVPIRAFLMDADGYGGMTAVHIRVLEKLIPGIKIQWQEPNSVIITTPDYTAAQPKVLEGWTIAYDEGHGGSDPGAVDGVNPAEGDYINTVEAELNDQLGDKIIARLKNLGANVVVTRPLKDYVSLQTRCDIANNARAAIFVSGHFNAYMAAARGVETFCYRGSLGAAGGDLARAIHKNMVSATGFKDRGVREEGFYVLKNTWMPAALFEGGFITNPDEEKVINTDEFMNKLADAVVKGIVEFCETHKELKK